MYRCALEEFINLEVHLVVLYTGMIWNGNYTGIYTNVWIARDCMRITLRCHYWMERVLYSIKVYMVDSI